MAYVFKAKDGSVVRFEPFKNQKGVVEKEQRKYTSKVTSSPIEGGTVLTDHVAKEPGQLTVSGVIVGGEIAINRLQSMWSKRKVITYTGRCKMGDLVITSLNFDYTAQNAKGASFTVTLKHIEVVGGSGSSSKKKMTEQDAGKSKSSAKKSATKATTKAGTKTAAVKTVSKSAAQKAAKQVASKAKKSLAPATRKTGAYSGIS